MSIFSKPKPELNETKNGDNPAAWSMPKLHITGLDNGFHLLAEIVFIGKLSHLDHQAAIIQRIETTAEFSRLRAIESLHADKTAKHASIQEPLSAIDAKISKEKSDLASEASMQRLRDCIKEQDLITIAIDASNKELGFLTAAVEEKRKEFRLVCSDAVQAYRQEINSKVTRENEIAERNLFEKAGQELIELVQSRVDWLNASSLSVPSILSQFRV